MAAGPTREAPGVGFAADSDPGQSAGDRFTRNLFAWQGKVLADRGMTLLALHVAIVIGQHLNRRTGEAWPSQARICEVLDASRRGVQGAIEQLVNRGHLLVIQGNNRKGGNRYRPLWSGDAPSPSHAHDGAHDSPAHAHHASHEDALHAHEDAHENSSHARESAILMRTTVRPNHLKEPSEGESISLSSTSAPKRARAAKTAASDADFDGAYQSYPRHVGRDAARRAYAAAIARGATPIEILAGVRRYATERTGESERYTAHMASWLNAGRWADAPIRPPYQANGGGRPSRFDPIADAARRLSEMHDD